eukprot:1154398-Pelagomonas_calceolata.AAC.1
MCGLPPRSEAMVMTMEKMEKWFAFLAKAALQLQSGVEGSGCGLGQPASQQGGGTAVMMAGDWGMSKKIRKPETSAYHACPAQVVDIAVCEGKGVH